MSWDWKEASGSDPIFKKFKKNLKKFEKKD
jgi:hypothetical protein